MGFFIYLGVLARLKNDGHLENLEEISGSSAGALLAFLFCVCKGDTTKILDFSLGVPVKNIVKPSIKNLLKNYGLISHDKIRKVLSQACHEFMDKIEDVSFRTLYEWFPKKLYVSSYCVDSMKTMYFSVDSTPTMSVLDALCASISIPFLFSSSKLSDGWNYVDGGMAENVPGGPFLGKSDVLTLKPSQDQIPQKIKDIKTYAINVLLSSMKMRHVYEFPALDIFFTNEEMLDFSASNDTKLKMFLRGYDFFLLKK